MMFKCISNISLCQFCAMEQALAGMHICLPCFTDLPIAHHTFMKSDIDPLHTEITTVCHYNYLTSQLILSYKNHKNLALLPIIVELFTTLTKPPENTLLLAMPSSTHSLRTRGFDHMHLITKALAKKWQLPIWQGVKHQGSGIQQKALQREERLTNMADQFILTSLPPTGKRLLIIDDVCTTGSSISALAHCLIETGLETTAIVLAHKMGS